MKTDRRAPDLIKEASIRIEEKGRAHLQAVLRDRWGEQLVVDGARGTNAAWLACALGTPKKAHELLVFSRGTDDEEAMARAIDYLDGVLKEIHDHGGPEHGFFLPLDFEGRPYDGGYVFVRGEVRDYAAEEAAAKLLGEPPPERLIRAD